MRWVTPALWCQAERSLHAMQASRAREHGVVVRGQRQQLGGTGGFVQRMWRVLQTMLRIGALIHKAVGAPLGLARSELCLEILIWQPLMEDCNGQREESGGRIYQLRGDSVGPPGPMASISEVERYLLEEM